MKTTRVLAAVFPVLMAGISSAFDVPLIVENKLADVLQNELVIVSLAQLKVPPEEMKAWEDIAVSDGADKLVCQVDDLLENGWDDKDELAFFIDLQPHERKNLKVEFLTKKREGGESSAEVTRIGDDLKVKNSFLSFNFRAKLCPASTSILVYSHMSCIRSISIIYISSNSKNSSIKTH